MLMSKIQTDLYLIRHMKSSTFELGQSAAYVSEQMFIEPFTVWATMLSGRQEISSAITNP